MHSHPRDDDPRLLTDLSAFCGHRYLRFRAQKFVRVPRRPVPFIALFSANTVFTESRVYETSSPQSPLLGVTGIVDIKFSDFSVDADQHSELFLAEGAAIKMTEKEKSCNFE
jgi:hypothetical protein